MGRRLREGCCGVEGKVGVRERWERGGGEEREWGKGGGYRKYIHCRCPIYIHILL